MKNTIRVLVADDHVLVREALAALLDAQDNLRVVAAVDNGVDAVAQCRDTLPDVALIDLVMPQLNGIDAAAQISEQCPSVRVVVVSMYSDIDYVFRAVRAGARGFVAKTAAAAELVKAIGAVCAGRRYFSGPIAESVVEDYIRLRSDRTPLERLSARERQILQLISEGRSSTAIAQCLSLSPKTVDTYRSRMMGKLHITELPALIKFAIVHGITPPQ